MSNKKWLKRVSAILLTVCMIAGTVQYVPELSRMDAVEAAAPYQADDYSVAGQLKRDGYSRVIPEDYGLESGVYTRDQADKLRTDVYQELASQGYTRVTPEDFGLEYKRYDNTAGTTGVTYQGTKTLSSGLDKTYIDVDISYYAGSNTVDNSLVYGTTDGTGGVYISGITSGTAENGGETLYIRDYSVGGYYVIGNIKNPSGITTITETFNLKFAIDFGTAANEYTPATVNVWVNNIKVYDNKTLNVTSVGNGMTLTLGAGGWIEISEPEQEMTYTQGSASLFTEDMAKTFLDVDISFKGNNTSDTGIRFVGDGSKAILITGYESTNRLDIMDPSNRNTVYNRYEAADMGIKSVAETFNLKLAIDTFTLNDTGKQATITYRLWINEKLVDSNGTITITCESGQKFNRMAIDTKEGTSITVENPADNLDERLERAGYTRVTPEDVGLADCWPESAGAIYGSQELDRSFDKTYVDVNIKFYGYTSDAGLIIGGDGSENSGILIYREAVEEGVDELVVTEPKNQAEEDTTRLNFEETVADKSNFANLKLAMDYGATCDNEVMVTYSMWINQKLVIEDQVIVATMGRNIGVQAVDYFECVVIETPDSIAEYLEEEGYQRYTPSDFGLEGTLTETKNTTPLDDSATKVYWDVDVSFDNNNTGNTHLRFGEDDWGIRVTGYTTPDCTNIGGIAFSGEYFNTFSVDRSKTEMMSPKSKTNVKVAYDFETKKFSVWVNDVNPSVENIPANLDNPNISMSFVKSSDAHQFTLSDPVKRVSEYGYKRLTMADNFGLADGAYYSEIVAVDHYRGSSAKGVTTGSLVNTYLDMDVAFSRASVSTCLRYASSDGWGGISIYDDGEGLYLIEATHGIEGKDNAGNLYSDGLFPNNAVRYTYEQMGVDPARQLKDPINLKIAMVEIGNGYELERGCPPTPTNLDGWKAVTVHDLTLAVWVNNKYMGTHTFEAVPRVGTQAAIYTDQGYVSLGAYTEKTLTPEAYNIESGDNLAGYLVTGTEVKVYKDGVLQSGLGSGSVLGDNYNEVGTYTIERIDDNIKSTQTVCIYRLGDINCDGSVAIADGGGADVTALETLLTNKAVTYNGNEYKVTTASDYAADIDNDGNVGLNDLELMKEVQKGSIGWDEVKAKYHVPAVTYDYLGGDEVMPIFGFYGPYANDTKNFITDDIFSLLKNSGLNMIVYTSRGIDPTYGSGNDSVIKAMEMAQKYNLGYYADDVLLNTAKFNFYADGGPTAEQNSAASPLETSNLARFLTRYSHYENYLGVHLVDEPDPKSDAYDLDKELVYYEKASENLNTYANHHGFINAYPYYSNYFSTTDSYKSYLRDIANTGVKMLSYDYYPFEAITYQGTKYFEQLIATKEVAEEYSIPFWAIVQAGGNFDNNGATPATKEQMLWNANTALAFGAKGIGWFSALQPDDKPATAGIVTQEGEKSEDNYDAVQKANKQIAAVDEVLMKAKNTGVMTTGTAASDVPNSVELSNGTDMLQSITGSNALVGCFDYRDTEAFYVVNYDTTKAQTIALTFGGKSTRDYRVIRDGATSFGTTVAASTGTRVVLENIPAGEAVLVVLEDRMVEMSETEVSKYRGDSKLVTYDGYLVPDAEPGYEFAGWYDADDNPLTTWESGKAYAKYVDADVMTTKAQILKDTKTVSRKSSIRFLSTVDSTKYNEVGFFIKRQGKAEEQKVCKTVYSRLYYAGQGNTTEDTTMKPTMMSPQSTYFLAYSYWNVKNKNFSYTFDVTPYRETMDGTIVRGETVTRTINMGAKGTVKE